MALACRVKLLDDSEIKIELEKKGFGSDLLDSVCQYLNLVDKEYFGLVIKDTDLQRKWIKPDKHVKKQVRKGGKLHFDFLVKFYPASPSDLKEEVTKYQICLQIRRDLQAGNLTCPPDRLAHLSSYWLQSEFGDGEEDSEEVKNYLSSFNYLSGETSLPEFEEKVISLYRARRGMKPVDADTQFLTTASSLSMYGVHFYTGKDRTKKDIKIGISSKGVIEKPEAQKATVHSWKRIKNIVYKKNKFKLKLLQPPSGGDPRMKKTFYFDSEDQVHGMWKIAVEHHGFYRLDGKENKTPERAPSQKGAQKKKKGSILRRLSSKKKKPKMDDDDESGIKRRPTIVERSSSLRRSASLLGGASGSSRPRDVKGGSMRATTSTGYGAEKGAVGGISSSDEKRGIPAQDQPTYAKVDNSKKARDAQQARTEEKDEDMLNAVMGKMDPESTSRGSSTLLLTETIPEEDEGPVEGPTSRTGGSVKKPTSYARLRGRESPVTAASPTSTAFARLFPPEARQKREVLETDLDAAAILNPDLRLPKHTVTIEDTETRREVVEEVWETTNAPRPSIRKKLDKDRKDVHFEDDVKKQEEKSLPEMKKILIDVEVLDDVSQSSSSSAQEGEVQLNTEGIPQTQISQEDEEVKKFEDDVSESSSSVQKGEVQFNTEAVLQMQTLPVDEEAKVEDDVSESSSSVQEGEVRFNTEGVPQMQTMPEDEEVKKVHIVPESPYGLVVDTKDEDMEEEEDVIPTIKEYVPSPRKESSDEESEVEYQEEEEAQNLERTIYMADKRDIEPYDILETSPLDYIQDQHLEENVEDEVESAFIDTPNILLSPAEKNFPHPPPEILLPKREPSLTLDEDDIRAEEDSQMDEDVLTEEGDYDKFEYVQKEEEDSQDYEQVAKEQDPHEEYREKPYDQYVDDLSCQLPVSSPTYVENVERTETRYNRFSVTVNGLEVERFSPGLDMDYKTTAGEKIPDGAASTTAATLGDDNDLSLEDLDRDILYEEEHPSLEDEDITHDDEDALPTVQKMKLKDVEVPDGPSPQDSTSCSTSLSDLTDNTDELCQPDILEKTWSQGAGLDEEDELFRILFRTPPRRRRRNRNRSEINPREVPKRKQEAIAFKNAIDDDSLSPRRTGRTPGRRGFIPSWPFDPMSLIDSRDLCDLDRQAVKAAIDAQRDLQDEIERIEDMEMLDDIDFTTPDVGDGTEDAASPSGINEKLSDESPMPPPVTPRSRFPPREPARRSRTEKKSSPESDIDADIALRSRSPSASPRMVGEAFIPGVPDFVPSVVPNQLKTPSVSDSSEPATPPVPLPRPKTQEELEAMKFPKAILKFSAPSEEKESLKYRYSPPITECPKKRKVQNEVMVFSGGDIPDNAGVAPDPSSSGRSTPQSSSAAGTSQSDNSSSTGSGTTKSSTSTSSFPRFIHSVFPLRRSSSPDRRGRSKTRRKREKKQKNKKKRNKSATKTPDTESKPIVPTIEVTSPPHMVDVNDQLFLPSPPHYSAVTQGAAPGIPVSMYFPSASKVNGTATNIGATQQTPDGGDGSPRSRYDQESIDKIVLSESDDAHSDGGTPVTARRAEGYDEPDTPRADSL